MPEIRTKNEGSLRWVQASANTANGFRVWTTASAAATALMGYVTNFSITPHQQGHTLIMERNQPDHWKAADKGPYDVSFDVQFGITANYPPTGVTASGGTVPVIHMEFRAAMPEIGATSAMYAQAHGVVCDSLTMAEGEPNTYSFKGRALAVNAWTASGYLG